MSPFFFSNNGNTKKDNNICMSIMGVQIGESWLLGLAQKISLTMAYSKTLELNYQALISGAILKVQSIHWKRLMDMNPAQSHITLTRKI